MTLTYKEMKNLLTALDLLEPDHMAKWIQSRGYFHQDDPDYAEELIQNWLESHAPEEYK